MAAAIYDCLRDFVLTEVIVPVDGTAMAIDAAFKIDRKALTVKALRELANQLEGGRRGPAAASL